MMIESTAPVETTMRSRLAIRSRRVFTFHWAPPDSLFPAVYFFVAGDIELALNINPGFERGDWPGGVEDEGDDEGD